MNRIAHALVLLLSLGSTACGGEDKGGADGGAARPAPAGDLTTRTDAYELTTLQGKKKYTYSIDLPAGYERGNITSSIHIWQVKDTSAKKAPRVRVAAMKQPMPLDKAVAIAAKGMMGPREVVFKEETEHTMVVVARDANGAWTQVDGWAKGEGRRPHCWVELHEVAVDGSQVEWAKAVARTLRHVSEAPVEK